MWQDKAIAHLESVVQLINSAPPPTAPTLLSVTNVKSSLQAAKQEILRLWPKPIYGLTTDEEEGL
jgi:hypothetical protein